jgi:hypothetical protein
MMDDDDDNDEYNIACDVSVTLYNIACDVSLSLYNIACDVSVSLYNIACGVSVSLYNIACDVSVSLYNIACDVCFSVQYSMWCVCFSHKITSVHRKAIPHDFVDQNSHKYVQNLLPCCEWGTKAQQDAVTVYYEGQPQELDLRTNSFFLPTSNHHHKA